MEISRNFTLSFALLIAFVCLTCITDAKSEDAGSGTSSRAASEVDSRHGSSSPDHAAKLMREAGCRYVLKRGKIPCTCKCRPSKNYGLRSHHNRLKAVFNKPKNVTPRKTGRHLISRINPISLNNVRMRMQATEYRCSFARGKDTCSCKCRVPRRSVSNRVRAHQLRRKHSKNRLGNSHGRRWPRHRLGTNRHRHPHHRSRSRKRFHKRIGRRRQWLGRSRGNHRHMQSRNARRGMGRHVRKNHLRLRAGLSKRYRKKKVHFRRRRWLPRSCNCRRSLPKQNGVCHYYIYPSTIYCKSRTCSPKYVCVDREQNTGIVCMYRRIKSRIVLTRPHHCETVRASGYMYVPYAAS